MPEYVSGLVFGQRGLYIPNLTKYKQLITTSTSNNVLHWHYIAKIGPNNYLLWHYVASIIKGLLRHT